MANRCCPPDPKVSFQVISDGQVIDAKDSNAYPLYHGSIPIWNFAYLVDVLKLTYPDLTFHRGRCEFCTSDPNAEDFELSPLCVAVLGDSLLQGIYFPTHLADSYAEVGINTDITNLTLGGRRIGQLQTAFNAFQSAGKKQQDVGVVNIGINDIINATANTGAIVAEYVALINSLCDSGCFKCLLLLDQSPFGGHSAWNPIKESITQDLRTAINGFSTKTNVTIVNSFDALSTPGTFPGPQPTLDAAYTNPDQLHWNSTAGQLVSDLIRDAK